MELGSCRFYYKSLLRVILVLGFVWFLLVSVHHENRTWSKVAGSRALLTRRHVRRINAHHRKLELNFVSKRRVPNGPDPIHNRRAGNSHQPPGRRA